MRRLVIESDYHAGHWAGLTPPDWYQSGKKGKHQKELWEFRQSVLKDIGHIDFLVVNGDCIDGKGTRSGGSELSTSDRAEQCEMAAASIDSAGASECGIIYGTPYHTGQDEDWEQVVANKCVTPIAFVSGQEFLEYDGVTFDIKHKVGGSTIPHGRHTAVAKEKLWNLIWAEREGQPKADVIVRSHVHYFAYCGGPDWVAMTTPAWQGHGSKFGVRQCSGTIDLGLIVFEIEDGEYSWRPILADLKQQVARVTKR